MAELPTRRIELPESVDRLLSWFVPPGPNSHEVRKRKVIVGFTLAILAWSPLYAALYVATFPWHYARIALVSLWIGMALVAAVPLLIRAGSPISTSIGLLGVSLGGLLALMCSITGGYRSPLLPWMVLHPLLALGFGGVRLAWIWTACVFVELALLMNATALGLPVYDLISPGAHDVIWTTTLVTITLTIFGVGLIYESIKNQTIADLERANQAKSDFLAHMSHEIRTPMTAILGFAEVLEEEKLSDQPLEHLRTIRRNGAHLLAVINDILDLSRVEAGHLELDLGSVEPARVLRDVAVFLEPRAHEARLELRVQIDPAVDFAIRSDATRLRQILINLTANAVKFTASGHVRLALCAESGGWLRFDVADTGPGIPREKQAEIFEAFAQVDSSMSRRHGGTGLGLAISRRLAHALGGSLEVSSEVGRGSTFSLRIPAERISDAEACRGDELELDSGSALRGRVLLAEDGADSRRLLVHLLERFGLEVEVAENGTRALARAGEAQARGTPFSLVLMDMQMPELDGYEATRRLRRAGFGGRIIALTAHAMDGSRETCIAAGCDEFLTKPVDQARLRALVARQLAHARAPALR